MTYEQGLKVINTKNLNFQHFKIHIKIQKYIALKIGGNSKTMQQFKNKLDTFVYDTSMKSTIKIYN